MVAQSVASIIGLREPAANGAIVRGIRAAEIVLAKSTGQHIIQVCRVCLKTFQRSNGNSRVWGFCFFLSSRHFLRHPSTYGGGTGAGSLAIIM